MASVVFFTFRFQEGTSTWLAQAGRTRLAGGSATWFGSIAGSPFAASPWRQEHGALWDVGPHLLALLVPALGPVTAVQAGAGLRDTVHLVLHHPEGVVSTVAVSHTVAPMSAGIEVYVHGDAGRLVLLPEERAAGESFAAAVDELRAAALTGAAHPLDVHFGRDVVAVLGRRGAGAGHRLPGDGRGLRRAAPAPPQQQDPGGGRQDDAGGGGGRRRGEQRRPSGRGSSTDAPAPTCSTVLGTRPRAVAAR